MGPSVPILPVGGAAVVRKVIEGALQSRGAHASARVGLTQSSSLSPQTMPETGRRQSLERANSGRHTPVFKYLRWVEK